jgi:hypothetical protein
MSHSFSFSGRFAWRLPLALMLTTLVTLCVELLYSRFISVLFMASDAYWIIAIALLGFGTGGAVVAAVGKRLSKHIDYLLPWLMWGIGLTALLPVFVFRNLRPELAVGGFYPEHYTLIFLLVSFCCFLVFLLASTFLSFIFMHYRELIGPLYFFDLLGAGLGCFIFVIFLTIFGLEYSLLVMSGMVVLASLLLVPRFTLSVNAALGAVIVILAGCAVFMHGTSPLAPFIGRELRMLYDYQGENVQVEYQKWDPIARIDIVSLPGERLKIPDEACYKLLTQDGGAPSILLQFKKPIEALTFPDQSLLGIAYWTKDAPSVLIIGPGGGPDVVAALRYQPRKVTAVELNKTTISAVKDHFPEFVDGIYNRPEVTVVHDDGRHFVRTNSEKYDVIQLTGVDTTVLAAGGNLSENYLYTIEAFGDYYDHLSTEGVLSLTYPDFLHWSFRAMSMLLKLMEDRGILHPEQRLVVSMSGGYINILLKKSPFTPDEVDTIAKHFTKPMYGLLLPLCYHLWGQYMPEESFPLYTQQNHYQQQGILYAPYHARNNSYNTFIQAWRQHPDSPLFWKAMGGFKPARDDRPFFFTPILVGKHFVHRIIWILVPIAIFILVPLALFKRQGMKVSGAFSYAIYFGCIGFAFIAMEMILLQKFVLFLGHPTYSFAVVLGTLLVTTGIGSLLSERVAGKPLNGIFIGISGITLFTIIFVVFMGPLTQALFRSALTLRIAFVAALITPLGFCMGMFFPNGIRLLGARSDDFVPWAWGINGSASVLGSLVSLFLAIKLGFSSLLLIALAVYFLAVLSAVRFTKLPSR